jgi:hypothetical protein
MRTSSKAALLGVILAAACGGGGGGDNGGVTVNSAVSSGDFAMSGAVGKEAGKLVLSLAAIRDPDDASKPVNGDDVALTVSTAESGGSTLLARALSAKARTADLASSVAPTLSCTLAKVTAAAGTKVDIVFINDTTGSMSGTVQGIADSISSFATSIADSGVDARFSMYTYGDAFATKASTGSEFTVGKGDFDVPSDLDDTERPYLGLSSLSSFQSFLTELKNSDALGTGGDDDPENTIGALDYAAAHVSFRGGASRAFVAIGDNPSHQAGDGDVAIWPATFQPATGDDLVSRMSAISAIHVVGYDYAYGGYYNLRGLADGTGGVLLDLPDDGVVDLSALHLQDWFTNALAGTCTTSPKGRYVIVVDATVTGSLGTVQHGELAFDVTVE